MKSWLKLRSLGYINLIYWKIGFGCKNGTRYILIEEVLQNVKITYVEIIFWKKLLPHLCFSMILLQPSNFRWKSSIAGLDVEHKNSQGGTFLPTLSTYFSRQFFLSTSKYFHWHWSYCVIETETLVFCTFLE